MVGIRWLVGLWLMLFLGSAGAASLDALAKEYAAAGREDDMPVIIERSSHDFDRTVENLKLAISGQNFRIIREQALTDGLELEGRNSPGRQTIVYFCNFSMVNEAIHIDRRVGQFLPCRITVAEQDGQVYLMSINPLRISRVFANDGLSDVCKQITRIYKDLISEATI